MVQGVSSIILGDLVSPGFRTTHNQASKNSFEKPSTSFPFALHILAVTSMLFTAITILSAATFASADTIEGLIKRDSSQEWCADISEDICLCESGISTFAGSDNSVCKKAVRKIGRAKVETALSKLIQSCNDKQHCTFPSYSVPSCSSDNVCDFSCSSGYSKTTDQNGVALCTCEGTKSVCSNGDCQYSCPSPNPQQASKRDRLFWGKEIQHTCKPGWTACGIVGGRARDWECIDTRSELESCGGCPVYFSPSHSGHQDLGVDCTSLPGVSDVSCSNSVCSVEKCLPGFKVSSSGQQCERDENDTWGSFGTVFQAVEVLFSN
ncbi:hypothetical protein BDP27DRAFT_1309749 [Rhodocollybia butyracea]|uniref:Protein CPL1-like domain-containing protein n=1 Tax=Rhodocollybia butyracea TaxID=206335 RepID=A0A9P5QC60_9AGAR|nr:hypothetical protein BDP27DRAFT_1309749 [Rhodocollybia butyracea]